MIETLHIETLAQGGAGIAHRDDGKTVFVPATAPGDTVTAEIKAEKPSYAQAKLLKVLEPGDQRVKPICSLANDCGGCTWQHIAPDAQLHIKRQNVLDSLVRIGKYPTDEANHILEECLPSKRTMGYRNKLELACNTDTAGRLSVGMHALESDTVLPIRECPLVICTSIAMEGSP